MTFTHVRRSRLLALAMVLTVVVAIPSAWGQWIVPPTPANQVAVSITPTVTFDPASGLYSYSYTIASHASSPQNVWKFALRLISPGTVGSSPPGWTFGEYEADPIVSWAATETGLPPSDWVDDGGLPPSARSIRPGSRLSGFRFLSPDPPGDVTFYAQGETQLPLLAPGADADALPPWDHHISVDSVSGTTVGPVPLNPPEFFEGGRRPAVDGFLVFLNLADGDTKTNPVGIVIRFGVRGENVDATTFTATLNDVDVTSFFAASPGVGDRVGFFTAGSSPLTRGKNVLITGVDGVVPGTSRTARDVDRITFTVK